MRGLQRSREAAIALPGPLAHGRMEPFSMELKDSVEVEISPIKKEKEVT
jgi:hypothetical protein